MYILFTDILYTHMDSGTFTEPALRTTLRVTIRNTLRKTFRRVLQESEDDVTTNETRHYTRWRALLRLYE